MTSLSQFATAFLSHASIDKAIVRKVARALGRCGVIPWVDELSAQKGVGLRAQLRRAARTCTTTVLFLSPEACASDWVEDELRAVLSANPERLLSATQGDPPDRSCIPEVLRRYVTLPGREAIDHNMVVDAGWRRPTAVARQIARHVYRGVGLTDAAQVNVLVDQRGDSGARVNLPLPEMVPEGFAGAPTLVFRHDLGRRSGKHLLRGRGWGRYQRDLRRGLGAALGVRGGPKVCEVHVAGGMQHGLALSLGLQLRRSNGVPIVAYGRVDTREVFDNRAQDFRGYLKGGNPACWQLHPEFAPQVPAGHPEVIDLFVGDGYRAVQAAAYRQATEAQSMPVWVPSQRLHDSGEVMALVADVVALLLVLGSPCIRLFTSLPVHALPLLAANLDRVAGGQAITMMEFTHAGARAEELYVPLACPFDAMGAS